MDPRDKQRCKCGHDLDLHGRKQQSQAVLVQPVAERSPGTRALPEPTSSPISLRPAREPGMDALLSKFWVAHERHLAEHKEQMRILNERRYQSDRKK